MLSSIWNKIEVFFHLDSANLQVYKASLFIELFETIPGGRSVGSDRLGLTETVIIELTQLNFDWNCQLELSLAIK